MSRSEPKTIVMCACGASLDSAKSNGEWTIGEPPIVCEYRTCKSCKSTRAYMPDDVIPLRSCEVQLTRADHVSNHMSLLDALECEPLGPGAVITRADEVLATYYVGANGQRGWKIVTPTKAGT